MFGAAGAVLVWYAVPRVFDTYRDYVVASLPGDQRHQYRTRTSGAVPLVVFSAVLLLVVVAKTTTAILALLVLVVWCASAFYRHYPTLLWVLAVWLNYPDGRAPTWTPRDSRIARHAMLHAFTAALVLLVTTTRHFGAPTELMALFFSPRGVPHHYWLV